MEFTATTTSKLSPDGLTSFSLDTSELLMNQLIKKV